MSQCQLFSNHGNVILVLAEDPDARLRDVALKVGITERAVQKIVRDLQNEGLVSVTRHGRRNRYRINTRKALRHPLDSTRTVGNLLNMMRDKSADEPRDSEVSVEAGKPDIKPEPRRVPRPVYPTGKKIGSGALSGGGTGPVRDSETYPDAETQVPESSSASEPESVIEQVPEAPAAQEPVMDIAELMGPVEQGEQSTPVKEEAKKAKSKRTSRKKSPASGDQQGSLF